MKGILGLLKTTLVGGIVFLLPIVVVAAIVGKAVGIARGVLGPLAARFPVDAIAGIGFKSLLAVAALISVCFLAGLVAKTRAARRFAGWLESILLANVPGYALTRSMSESVAGSDEASAMKAVLVRLDDAWQIAFLVERAEGGLATVFVPDAPNTRSGSLLVVGEDRITPLEVTLPEAMKCVRSLGLGSAALLNRVAVH
jgi:uncharacterized membrane protein